MVIEIALLTAVASPKRRPTCGGEKAATAAPGRAMKITKAAAGLKKAIDDEDVRVVAIAAATGSGRHPCLWTRPVPI